MKKGLSLLLCLVLLLALCAPVTALAEPSDGGPAIEKPVIVSIYDDTGALASGISVEIQDENGQAVDAWVTNGSTHTAFLTEGTYKLKIVDAPENYLIDQDEATIVVALEEAERRDDFVGECFLDHSHPNVCANPNHIGLETYAVHDSAGSVVAYCFNQNYDNPTPDSRYRRLVGTPELLYSLAQNKNGSVGPQELYDHVLAIIYHSGEVQAKYGLDNIMTRYLTNMAIKNFTDPTCFNTFDNDGNSMLARDENGKPIRDENGHYVFLPGGTVLGSIVNHARGDNGGQDVLPQEYRDAYHELISYTSHPSDYYLYIYYPDNFQPGNTDSYQCLLSVFTVEPIRTSLSVRSATKLEITKVWVDGEDQDGLRPDAATFAAGLHLLADGSDVTETYRDAIEITDNQDGSYTVRAAGLPKLNGAGEEIAYTLREDNFRGYTADKTSAADGETITNSHIPETTRIEVSKVWEDDSNRDGIRPRVITVHLLADDKELKSAQVTPDEDGNWAYAFEDLPKYAKGVEIRYSITEEPVDDYESNVEGFVITNTHSPETTRIEVSKTWDDADNNDGKRPVSITVNLLANGKTVQTVQITPDDKGEWAYAFENLPKYEGGKEIEYTVTEEPVPDYETTVDGFAITNTHIPETTRINVTKAWGDGNNKGKTRPDSITIHLLANGKEVQTVQIKPDDKGNWAHSFEDLPKYENGKEIKYTITEDSVKGYYTSISPTKDGFQIRNSTTPLTGDPSQSTLWVGLLAGSALALTSVILLLRRKKTEG